MPLQSAGGDRAVAPTGPGCRRAGQSGYWRLVRQYCQQGNPQAVLDEQWPMPWDPESWSEDAGADETVAQGE